MGVSVVVLALGLTLSACAAPTDGSGSTTGSDATGSPTARDTLVLADPYEDETLNPLLGYGDGGASKIYEGLVSYDAARRPHPLLASELPTASADGLTWTAKLRQGVRFHDGSGLDAGDVAATYSALLDPDRASTVASEYAMIDAVVAAGADTVTFRLKYPYTAFLYRLTLGVVPSEALSSGDRLDASQLNTEPVGTGPYELSEWRKGDRLVLKAFDGYHGPLPGVRTITVAFVADDNTRAQRMAGGDFDGAALPPALADGFSGRPGVTVVSHKSADQRNVMLPMKNPVTADLSIRQALNHAVDRDGMVKAILAGHGTPASGPVPPALTEYADTSAEFTFDPEQARRILTEDGWREGPGGVRVKAGRPARFTLMYPATDSVRKALAAAVASDAAKVGIDVELVGLGWEAIQPRMAHDALLMGGGTPFDPDPLLYGDLHSRHAEDGYNNPGSYANPTVDAALDRARRQTDPATRAAAYQQVQRELLRDPARVYLVFLDHTYVLREGWTGYEPVVDPHVHGGLGWGPWWNVERWKPRGGTSR